MSVYTPTHNDVMDFLRDHRSYSGAIALPGAPARPHRGRLPELLVPGEDRVLLPGRPGYRETLMSMAGRNPGAHMFPARVRGITWPSATQPYAWFRSDAGLYQDAAKTTLATSEGDPIGCWADISGHQRDVSTSGSTRPTLDLSAINGYAAALFSHAANSILQSATGLPALGACQFYVVCNVTSASGVIQVMCGCPDTIQVWLESGSVKIFRGTTASAAVPSTGWKYISANLNTGSGLAGLYWNGVETISAATIGTNTGTQFSIGGPVGYTGQSFADDIAEVIVYDTVLSTDERGVVQSYLAARYGL